MAPVAMIVSMIMPRSVVMAMLIVGMRVHAFVFYVELPHPAAIRCRLLLDG